MYKRAKANHPTLHSQVVSGFESAQVQGILPSPVHLSTESGHHRIEHRTVWTLPLSFFPNLYQAQQWAGFQTIVVVERTRHLWNQTTHEIQFYLCSLPPDSPRIAFAVRLGH